MDVIVFGPERKSEGKKRGKKEKLGDGLMGSFLFFRGNVCGY